MSEQNNHRTILEELRGFVDEIEGDTAFVTLSKGDEVFHGEYPAKELKSLNIQERRCFICRTILELDGKVSVELTPEPEVQLSEERQAEILKSLEFLNDLVDSTDP